ncbi:hypothetical protein BCIN_01g05630 [Botrytis cinerea B05.10]|uniref:Uncharacterized protein n=2 Tax=Botryotinia fuckeliana TaxID=40559 RepID=A0A384J5T3_BOTFB|nr:hypothetical protein BCIN_01g05630 [Botrytis cinerea B05.10]ATZ45859.1 hypothetical protein BCIN_01g05630 [Botrytis cinerea B05.10]CCD45517.1 hypothetical protein BofuT4_P045350.1 [Botrytis cinerea T4]
MAINKDDRESVAESDSNAPTIHTPPSTIRTPPSTISTPPPTIRTPPSTIIEANNREHQVDQCPHHSSSVPRPNSTYLIRASSSGRLLTLESGRVILAKPGDNRGSSIHWKCIEVGGWLRFQNAASGCFLGHNFWGSILCNVTWASGWERFSVGPAPNGGYYLMTTHWSRLWKIGMKGEYLAKIREGEYGEPMNTGEGEGQVIIWEFVKI